MRKSDGESNEEDQVVRKLVRLTTWSLEQWDSHLDLSVWWNKLRTTIPYSTQSILTWHLKHLFFLTLHSSPLPSIHLCPYFSSYFPHRLSLPFSLWVSVLSVSDTQWIREYLAAHYQTSLHLPLPLCAQAYQSENHCQDRCHWRNRNHGHNLHLSQLTDLRRVIKSLHQSTAEAIWWCLMTFRRIWLWIVRWGWNLIRYGLRPQSWLPC